jgi:hypothetical protein
MLLFSQVVSGVYKLIYSVLYHFLWQFFLTFKTATNLPQKLGVFLKILRIPTKRKSL